MNRLDRSVRPAKKPEQGRIQKPEQGRVRAFLNKAGKSSILLIPTSMLIFSLSTQNINAQATQNTSKAKTEQRVMEAQSTKTEQSTKLGQNMTNDKLPFAKSEKLTPLEMKARAEVVWDTLSQRYPKALSNFRLDRLAVLLPDSLEVEVRSNSEFRAIECEGHSVRRDVNTTLSTIFINADRPLRMDELAIQLCQSICAYNTFTDKTPFFVNDEVVMGYLMASTLTDLPQQRDWIAFSDESALLFFAKLMGPKELLTAYSSGSTAPLRQAYDSKFGTGQYDELLNADNKMQKILEQAESSGFGQKKVMAMVEEQAKLVGWIVPRAW